MLLLWFIQSMTAHLWILDLPLDLDMVYFYFSRVRVYPGRSVYKQSRRGGENWRGGGDYAKSGCSADVNMNSESNEPSFESNLHRLPNR